MLRVTSGKLQTINVGFRADFQTGRDAAIPQATWPRIATHVPSTTREEEYGWLDDIDQIRPWVGERYIRALKDQGYKIKNQPFELTIGVKADDINDDNVGLYGPRFKMMGDEVARFPDVLTYQVLKAGLTSKCFDGEFFFDTDHPYTKADGSQGTQANLIAGAGAPWFLLCTKRPLKPLIYQEREKFDFVALDRPTDERVFMKKELLYGTDGRANVGFGFWQMALCCTDTFNDTNVKALRKLGEKLLKNGGAPAGLSYDLFVAGTDFRDDADALFNTPTLAAGGGNPLYKAFDTIITAYLN